MGVMSQIRDHKVQVIAHRGGRFPGIHPLEVERCIEAAIKAGIKMAEVDLRRLGDGELVIEHDPVLGGVSLASLSYAELDRLCQKLGRPTPPYGSHILKRFAGAISFDLELKEPSTEEQVLELARSHLPPGSFVLKSFHDSVVLELKRLAPRETVGLLLGRSGSRFTPWTRLTEIFPEWRLRRARADFVSPHDRLARLPGFLPRMRRLGLPVWAWTVNDLELVRRLVPLLRAGDAIITDHPVEVRETLGRLVSQSGI